MNIGRSQIWLFLLALLLVLGSTNAAHQVQKRSLGELADSVFRAIGQAGESVYKGLMHVREKVQNGLAFIPKLFGFETQQQNVFITSSYMNTEFGNAP